MDQTWRTMLRKWELSIFRAWTSISKETQNVCFSVQALPLSVRASEGRVLMPHVPALVSETGPSESHSILTLTECRQTGSPVHWPIQNQSCHIMSLRSWRSSWCWRSQAPIRTNSCCVCWPGSGVCNCSSEWTSVKMMFKLSPRPQWCRSLLLQDRNRLYKNEANGKPGEHLYLQTVN